MMYTLWNSTGLIQEYETREEALIVAKAWWEGYQDQKITLSWMDGDEQVDQILYDGRDLEKAAGWLEICRMDRAIEKEEVEQ